MNILDIKLSIKRLKKLKKDLRPNSKERIEIFRQIKALKKQLANITIPDPAKEKLIAEILRLEPNFPKDLVNLAKFTLEQLRLHIDRVKNKHRPR